MRDKTKLDRQKTIEFIQKYRATEGFSPTLKEIAIELKKGEKNAANVLTTIINPLIAAGFLIKGKDGQPRTLRTPDLLPRPYYYKREVK